MNEPVVMNDIFAIRVFESIKSINKIPFSCGFECGGKCGVCPAGISSKCFFVELTKLIEKTNKEMVRKELFGGDE